MDDLHFSCISMNLYHPTTAYSSLYMKDKTIIGQAHVIIELLHMNKLYTCQWQLLSADYLCKQFGLRSGPTKCRA